MITSAAHPLPLTSQSELSFSSSGFIDSLIVAANSESLEAVSKYLPN